MESWPSTKHGIIKLDQSLTSTLGHALWLSLEWLKSFHAYPCAFICRLSTISTDTQKGNKWLDPAAEAISDVTNFRHSFKAVPDICFPNCTSVPYVIQPPVDDVLILAVLIYCALPFSDFQADHAQYIILQSVHINLFFCSSSSV